MKYLKWTVPVLAIIALLVVWSWPEDSLGARNLSTNPPKKNGISVSSNEVESTGLVGSPLASKVASTLLNSANEGTAPNIELPQSLVGTEVDGGFRVDESGNLIIELGIKRYFDYFLATVGEESLAEITARIHHAISTQLQEPAKSQALDVLQGYLSYKAALYELEQEYEAFNLSSFDNAQLPLLERRQEAILETRRRYLDSDAVEAFFAEEEAVDRYTLEKLKITHNDQLSDEDRVQKIAQLETLFPDHIQQQNTADSEYQQYTMKESNLLNNGASSAEIHQLRAQTFGEDGAERLAALDEKRATWNKRNNNFPNEISFRGCSKIGSETALIAPSN